jgi:hypothetical protein
MFGLLLFKHTNCFAIYPPLPPGAYDATPTTRSPAMTALCLSSVTADAVCPLPAHSRGAHFNSRHMAIPAHFVGTLHFTFIGTLQLPWHMWWPAFQWLTQQSHVFLLICSVSIVHLYSVIMRWTSQSSDHGNAATASQPQ